MYGTGPIWVFVQKAAHSVLFQSFDERNVITRDGFTIWRCARSDGKIFIFSSLLVGRCCKNSQSARGPAQCKFGSGNNMVSWRNHLLCHFSIKIHFHLASVCAKKYLWKKLDTRNAHWTNYWFWMKGSWAPGCTCTHKLIFFTKNKNLLRKIFEWIIIYS